ncbi:hypothetical protein [Streptomyces sp. NPDC057250]|uniref:hypothetical protein n=1 Tax=Streptomyces sp. NPDC057250 TaxID=3346068 RepID=UPI00363328F9
MKKTFALRTEPHEAQVGDTVLLFKAEVYGDEFLDAYEQLQEAQRASGIKGGDLSGADPKALRRINAELQAFLARQMLPESAKAFARWDVVAADGSELGTYHDPQEAADAADVHEGANVVDKGMRLPSRVLVELLEWVVELYSGGENRPTTSSSGSAPASSSPGTRGRGASRSRG